MGAVSHHLEAAGLATTGISLIREQTERMRIPRALWVPFELGRPFGAPDQPDFQRRVLRASLALLERTDGPVVLADFADEAPTGPDEGPWVCPISFHPSPSTEPDLVAAVKAEIGSLAPWAELGPSRPPTSGLQLPEIVDLLHRLADPDGTTAGGDQGRLLIESVRLAADDLRAWYLDAAVRQPGRAPSAELARWFWRDTAAARLLGALAGRLVDHHDPVVRGWAARGLVPRDHWDAIVPRPASDGEPEPRSPEPPPGAQGR